MEENITATYPSGLGINGSQGQNMDGKTIQSFQKNFVHVQNILDQNRVLIKEINQNQESKMADSLSRNVGLIRELNNNIRRVVDLYADLSTSFTKSMDHNIIINNNNNNNASSEGDSTAPPPAFTTGFKRHRPL